MGRMVAWRAREGRVKGVTCFSFSPAAAPRKLAHGVADTVLACTGVKAQEPWFTIWKLLQTTVVFQGGHSVVEKKNP